MLKTEFIQSGRMMIDGKWDGRWDVWWDGGWDCRWHGWYFFFFCS